MLYASGASELPSNTGADLRGGVASSRDSGAALTVTVVIACFDDGRYEQTTKSVGSVLEQDYPCRLVVVVDHNLGLAARLRANLPAGVSIVENRFARGASGARNSGALDADSDLVAFLDDDACAAPEWLRGLVVQMASEEVVGAGGMIRASWDGGAPRWFPPEFGWVVGASIDTHASTPIFVRNVWSGSMVVRRQDFQAVGGFRESWGKLGRAAEPEDTELCLRLGSSGKRWMFVPSAVVHHEVPAQRATLGYFWRRCWAEGVGKARLRRLVHGSPEALSEESVYLRRVIPRALIGHAKAAIHGDTPAVARAVVAVTGATLTAIAFAVESVPRLVPTGRMVSGGDR